MNRFRVDGVRLGAGGQHLLVHGGDVEFHIPGDALGVVIDPGPRMVRDAVQSHTVLRAFALIAIIEHRLT